MHVEKSAQFCNQQIIKKQNTEQNSETEAGFNIALDTSQIILGTTQPALKDYG